MIMEGVYHDPEDPQLDAVERYRKFPNDNDSGEKERVYHLYFLRSQIMGDVMFQLRIITRGRRQDDNQDNGLELTEDLKYMFNGWIDKYISLAKKPMARYLAEPNVSGMTSITKDKDDIDICFKIGEWWNVNVLGLLSSKIRDYVVTGVMYEYLQLYFGAGNDIVQSKGKDLVLVLDDIKNLMLSYKAGSVQKQFHPFP